MSEILEEMSKLLLRHPRKVPSAEAAQVALFFANAAWNECVGLTDSREGFRHVWETIEAENPELWNEFKSNDIDAMIDELVEYKAAHYPNDRRRILSAALLRNGFVSNGWDQPLLAWIPDGRCSFTGWCGLASGRKLYATYNKHVPCLAKRRKPEWRKSPLAWKSLSHW